MKDNVIMALKEYIERQTVSAYELMEKYKVTPSEFWSGFAMLKSKAPK